MTVHYYRSDDASAPVLNGSNGSLIAVLDACLVDGYGAKAAAGWSKPFSGTNVACYRGPAPGLRHYLRVSDANTNVAMIRAFGNMTDVNTGTDPYPTTIQLTNGFHVFKSSTTDTIARAWLLVATQNLVYFLPHANIVAANLNTESSITHASGSFVFGEFIPYENDSWNSIIIGNNSNSTGSPNGTLATNSSANFNSHYIARDHTGGGSATPAWKVTAADSLRASPAGGGTYPNFPDGYSPNLRLSRFIVGNGPIVRGILPGIWGPLHNQPAQPGDTINGTGALAGRQFLFCFNGHSSTPGRILLEISNTW